METLRWRRRQRRLTIVDRLATDDPDSLTSCSFSDLGDAIYDLNNNSYHADMISYYLSDYVEQFWPHMYETNNNNGEMKRQLRLSNLLEESEKDSVRNYVGGNAALLASGICQLLPESNGVWSYFGVGVLCLIKDFDQKRFSISLVDPSPDGAPAHVLWNVTISRDFVTFKNHSHLLTFEIKEGLFGLNFHEMSEAEEFHSVVMRLQLEYLNKKSVRQGPKRQAPPPPSPVIPLTTVEPVHTAEETTSHGIEIPIVRKDKKKKKGLLRKIFGEKEKKRKKTDKPTISQPTNFQHVQHGLENLNDEQNEIIKKLISKGIDIQPGNQNQLQFLLVEKYEVMKNLTLEEKTEDHKREEENQHPSFQRSSSNGLSDARSSIMISKGGKGNKPRDIKKQSNNRRESQFDPLRPNWDEEMPPQLATITIAETVPVLPPRTDSRRPPLNRQDTPPNPRFASANGTPRLPPRTESTKIDIPPHVAPPRPPSPPKSLPPHLASTAPTSAPPPPPTLMIPKVTPPSNIPAPPPPPHPLSSVSIKVDPPSSTTGSNSLTTSVPEISPGRKSLLEEITSVNKSKFLRPVDRSPSRTDVSPTTGKGIGIIDAIQRELDARRTYIDSSDESSSEDGSDSWSD